MTSLVFNTGFLLLELLALIWLRRRPGPLAAVNALALLGLGSAFGGATVARIAGEGFFGMLRLHAWAIFAHGPLLLLAMAQRLGKFPRWRLAGRIAAGLLVLVAVDAFWIEPRWLEVSRITISSAKLERPVRIALLTDLQTDRVGDHERRALELAMAEKPDLILFGGDYVHLRPDRGVRALEELGKLRKLFVDVGLHAPLGIFAVGGNTESSDWRRLFEGLDVHVFERGGRVEVGELVVTGLTFPESVRGWLTVPAEERFHLVLGHAPDFALEDVQADLLLAGHCHGGQVVVPFLGPPVILSRVPRSWVSGAHEIAPGKTLVVSRGIGLERAYAPQLRFNCRPEIVVIDVVPAE